MKRYMNKVLTIAALLLLTSFGARAEQTVTIVIKPSTSAGTVSYSITNGVCTLTATPASGYYLTVDDLTATTSLDGGGVQVRRKAEGINVSNETLEITATDASADPSGTTKYTFTMPNDNYINVEVTAEFQPLIAITPSVSLTGWTYGSDPHVPQVSGNPGNGTVVFTYKAQGTDTFTETPPTETGTHTIKATVAAAKKYAGGETINMFTISQAAGSISYTTATVNKTYGDTDFTNTLTKIGDGTVTFASNKESVAIVDGDGKVTIKGNGEATITATVTDGTNYTYDTKTASYLVSVGKAAMEVTANEYTGTYDEQAHGITVNAPEGAAVKYGTTEGTYDLDASPTYTDAGTYTVFYKVTKENFTDITGSATVTISKAAGSISYETATINKTYGDAAFTNALTKTGDGTVTYASDNGSAATVDGNGKVTIKGNGEATITASVTDGTNYTYATKTATYKVIIGKADMEATAEGYTGTYDEQAHGITVNAPEGATVKYGTTEGAYNFDASPTYTNAGTYTVFYKVTKENYTDITGSQTVIISKAAGSISYTTATVNKTYGDTDFTNTLTKIGDGTVTFASNKESVAIVDGDGKVTIKGNGEATITATVTDGTNYTYDTKTASYLVSVGKAAMEVTANEYTGTYDEQAHGITVNAPEGAAVKYGTTEGTYDLDASPTYTDAGTYTVFYKVTKENFTDITGSATVTISKAAGSISYETATINKTYGDAAFTNALTKTGDGTVTYASDNGSAATVDGNGKVTIKGNGETTITATVTDGTNYTYATKTASYKLIVNKPQAQGYPLWIGDIQVTEENEENVLGDENHSFLYNPVDKTLLITNNQDETIVIESRLSELTIYLNGEEGNKLNKIFYNNLGNAENKGNLYFTAFNNTQVPSTVVIENTDGGSAIYGFEKVEYDQNTKVTIIEPENTTYKNGNMYYTITNDDGSTTEKIADKLTIGQTLAVIDQTVTFNIQTVQVKDEYGNPVYEGDGTVKVIDTKNVIVDDVLITLPNSGDPSSDEGVDVGDSDGRPGINIETVTMTDDIVKDIAKRVRSNGDDQLIPGGDSFANEYVGLTILLPAGEGNIKTDLDTDPGYEFHALIAEDDDSEPFFIPEGLQETPFHVSNSTYCYIYLVKTSATARSISPIGKRERAHGKVVSVGVSVAKAYTVNPPSEASGGVLPKSEDPVVEEEPLTGITTVFANKPLSNNKWYDLQGREIDQPIKKGLYILNNKKIVIK